MKAIIVLFLNSYSSLFYISKISLIEVNFSFMENDLKLKYILSNLVIPSKESVKKFRKLYL